MVGKCIKKQANKHNTCSYETSGWFCSSWMYVLRRLDEVDDKEGPIIFVFDLGLS